VTRLGIRCEHIRLSREKISDRSVQLPVYAIVHETGSSVVTFELKGMFLYARTGEERSLCDYCLSEKVWLDLDQDHLFFYPKPLEAPKA
jgi:hypothetical protein